ncbi:MAG: ABC transporter transmembrane domain-containing protein [Fimbriimonadales bacterium]
MERGGRPEDHGRLPKPPVQPPARHVVTVLHRDLNRRDPGRLSADVSGVQSVVSDTLTDVISNLAVVVTTAIAMLMFDWRLALLTFAVVPFFAVVGAKMGEKMRVVRKGAQEQVAEMNAMMQETLSVSGVLLTKTSGRRDTLQAKFAEENEKLAKWQIKQQVIMYLFMGLIRLIFSLVPALIYWLAGFLMVRGKRNITVGTLAAFHRQSSRMFFPLTGLANAQVQVISSFALFDRIFEYLDMEQDIVDRPDAKPLPRRGQGARLPSTTCSSGTPTKQKPTPLPTSPLRRSLAT